MEWDMSTGKFVREFIGHKDRVYALALHPNGTQLLSAGSFDKSLKLWDLASGNILRNFQGNVYPVLDLVLSEDDRTLLINAYDEYGGDVYAIKLNQYKKVKNLHPIEKDFRSMAFQADSGLLYGATTDGTLSLMETAQDLTWKSTFEFNATIHSLSFLPNTVDLIVQNRFRSEETFDQTSDFYLYKNGDYTIKVRNDDFPGIKQAAFINAFDYYVFQSTWEQNTLSRVDGSINKVQRSVIDTTLFNPSMIVNDDGSRVGLISGHQIIMYNDDLGDEAYKITIDQNSEFDEFRSAHFVDGTKELLVCGGGWSDGYILAFDLETGKLLRSKSDFLVSQNVIISDSQQRYIIVGGEDGRVKFLDYQTFEPIITLINFADTDGDWAAIHPSGLFDGSDGAIEDHLYFTYGLEIIELAQLKERYSEPGLLQKTLGFNEDPIRDVDQFKSVQLYPEAKLSIKEDKLNIDFEVRNGGVGKVSLYINNKELVEDLSSLIENKQLEIDLTNYKSHLIQGEENEIAIITSNAENSLVSSKYTSTYTPKKPRGFSPMNRPSLHAIVIGTSNYRGEELDLNYADKDAEDIANALQVGGSELFEGRIYPCIFDAQYTRS